jgi:hypothetical protein
LERHLARDKKAINHDRHRLAMRWRSDGEAMEPNWRADGGATKAKDAGMNGDSGTIGRRQGEDDDS